jgi:endonuclease/exonuclease/phosphatase family metal-dependent hydrolase
MPSVFQQLPDATFPQPRKVAKSYEAGHYSLRRMPNSSLRVLTLNCLWSAAARPRLAAIAPLLDETGIDILCLQEVVLQRNVRLLERHLKSYRPAVFRPLGLHVTGGLVSFARQEIECGSYEVFQRRGDWWNIGVADRLIRKGFLASRLPVGDLPAVVINTHLLANYDEDWSPGNRFARQQRSELEQIAEAIGRIDDQVLLIVAGDFNVPAATPMFQEFLARCGLRNAFSEAPAEYRLIDHVLYRHPSGRELRVEAALRFQEPLRLSNGRSVRPSDHPAVEVQIALD